MILHLIVPLATDLYHMFLLWLNDIERKNIPETWTARNLRSNWLLLIGI